MTITTASQPTGPAPVRDPAGALCTPVGTEEVKALERLLAQSGLATISLRGRLSVVFIYPGTGAGRLHPELEGCTAEVCTFASERMEFARHGIQLVGLTTRPGEPAGDFFATLPFPVGHMPEDTESELVEFVEREGRKYAVRTSFVVFPDGTGIRIGGIRDSAAHVRKCFDLAIARRLQTYRRAIVAGIERDTRAVQSTVELREFLPNGSSSISIARVELKSEVVCKMADPTIVAEEAGYMERINDLLVERGHAPLFPAVLSVCADERPGWYLMAAADPDPIAPRLFEDAALTKLRQDRLHLLLGALGRLASLYDITFRREIPRVSRYHYLERFRAIPARSDFRETFEFVFDGRADLDEMLRTRFVLEGGFVCRPYQDQIRFLSEQVEELLQPVGAYLHGDVHLPNMLLARDGSGIVFIDPRTVWDGNDVGDPGFGDPMYDYATLLHSLHYMAAVLKAIDEGNAEALLRIGKRLIEGFEGDQGAGDGAPILGVAPGLLRLADHPTVEWFLDWMDRVLPARIRGPHWKARLHVGAANATLGWLKFARSVQNHHAWSALFIATLYHLELGRRLLESPRSDPDGPDPERYLSAQRNADI